MEYVKGFFAVPGLLTWWAIYHSLARFADWVTVVGVSHGRPILLRDVADQIIDGPAEPTSYVNFGVGRGALHTDPHAQVGAEFPAVTITVAKRKGTNATIIANHVLARIAELKGNTLPSDLNITTPRNCGETAKAKSDELLKHLLLATFSVTLLIAIFLGWRKSGVVLLAIPVTLALTLGIFYLLGYTRNRVKLFALIFSIGILVGRCECRGREYRPALPSSGE